MRRQRFAIALIVLAVLAFTLARVEWTRVAQVLAGAAPVPLALAALGVVLPLWARSLRAAALLRRSGHPGIPFARVAAVTVFGFAMSSLTPAGSGDLLRIAALRPHGVAPATAAALVVYERALDVAMMALLLAVALPVSLLPPGPAAVVCAALAVAVALGAGALLALGRRVGRAGGAGSVGDAAADGDAARWLARAPAWLRRALPPADLGRVLLEPAVLGPAAGITVLVFASEALRPWLSLEALGIGVGFFGAWSVFTLAWLAGMASLLPLGVGSWEAAAIWAFGLYGVDPSTAAAGALAMRAAVTLPAVVAGMLALGWLRRALPEVGAPAARAAPQHRPGGPDG